MAVRDVLLYLLHDGPQSQAVRRLSAITPREVRDRLAQGAQHSLSKPQVGWVDMPVDKSASLNRIIVGLGRSVMPGFCIDIPHEAYCGIDFRENARQVTLEQRSGSSSAVSKPSEVGPIRLSIKESLWSPVQITTEGKRTRFQPRSKVREGSSNACTVVGTASPRKRVLKLPVQARPCGHGATAPDALNTEPVHGGRCTHTQVAGSWSRESRHVSRCRLRLWPHFESRGSYQ